MTERPTAESVRLETLLKTVRAKVESVGFLDTRTTNAYTAGFYDALEWVLERAHSDGHAPGCAVFSLASYGRSTPIPCTCGFEDPEHSDGDVAQ